MTDATNRYRVTRFVSPDFRKTLMPANKITIRTATTADENDILALNAESVSVTSPMDSSRLRMLVDLSAMTSVADVDGGVAGFLIAMADGCAYENGNYRWFAERLNRFIYVDRIVVSGDRRSSGIGHLLYSHVEDWAITARIPTLAAEVDIDPPNTASLRFHEKSGFVQIGKRLLDNGKTVSMQVKALAHDRLSNTSTGFDWPNKRPDAL